MVVHNITIAYKDFKDGERTSELSLLQGAHFISQQSVLVEINDFSHQGKFPKEIHLFVEKLNAEDIPEDDVQKVTHSISPMLRLLFFIDIVG